MNDDPGDWFQVYAFLNPLAHELQFKKVDAFVVCSRLFGVNF